MFLIIIKGLNVGNVFPIDKIGPMVIGREKECDIRILDLMMSRKHCQVEKRNDNFYIKDLGSTNKTFVNKNPVDSETELKFGDLIEVGGTTFLFTNQKDIPIKSVEDYNKLRISQTMRFHLPPK